MAKQNFIIIICDVSSPNSTVSADSQTKTHSWILSVTSEAKTKIQSRGVVNPTGLTNCLLSLLRGINLSDFADSAHAMKWHSALRLTT